jgi:hypothetical protein
MMVRIHWFLRPSELAGIRVKREELEVFPFLHKKTPT